MDGRSEAQRRREARIRRNTSAPGPKPAGPGDDPSLLPGPGESLDRLAGDFCIFQLRGGHRYSTDDLLCAYFACELVERRGLRVERALDLGAGIGSVLMLVAWRLPEARAEGVEAQPVSVGLARRSIRYNGLEGRVSMREGDIRDPALIPEASFDLVTGSPPYYAPARGVVSAAPQRGPCRFELRGGVEAYLAAMARALRPSGAGVLVQTWVDRGRIREAASSLGLSLSLAQPVIFKEGREPLIGLFAIAREGKEEELPPLVVRRADGAYSEEYREVRRKTGYPVEGGFA